MRARRLLAAAGTLLGLFLLVPAPGPALAGPPRGYGETMRWYEEAAEAGDREAQFLLGYILERGVRGSADPSRAAVWYRKAAQAGHVQAQFRLGFLYSQGIGVAVDPATAALWYEKAARQGDLRSQYNLAVLHDERSGPEADPLRAAYWYETAARRGLAEAQYNLALLYAGEADGLYDLVRAYAWMAAAAAGGHPLAASGQAALEVVMKVPELEEGRRLYESLAACCAGEAEAATPLTR